MSDYQPTIGLEIHAELGTKTKMFCNCPNPNHSNQPESIKPNTYVCPVCLGLPGSLPVPNLEAVKMTLMIAKALNCKIAKVSKWDRKNYFYPDLPKGYQISQYDKPLASNGKLQFSIDITRVHLEEDTGKLIHPAGADYSLIDFNRSGVPLVEMVTEPVIKSAQEAKAFAQEYQLILRYLSVSDADMEKGQMRVEANVSVRHLANNESKPIANKTTDQRRIISYKRSLAIGEVMGTKVEIKNLNSFRSVERAIEYEIKRQIKILEAGDRLVQETRGWDEAKQQTVSQRTKETASDYRYFPEPDIPPLQIQNSKFKIQKLPELPNDKRQKLAKIGIRPDDIEVLVADLNRLRKFEAVNGNQAVANLLVHRPETVTIPDNELIELAKLPSHLQKTKLAGGKVGKATSEEQLKSVITSVIKDNTAVIADIKGGKPQAIGVLIGQVMAKTKGSVDPKQVRQMIEDMLELSS